MSRREMQICTEAPHRRLGVVRKKDYFRSYFPGTHFKVAQKCQQFVAVAPRDNSGGYGGGLPVDFVQ